MTGRSRLIVLGTLAMLALLAATVVSRADSSANRRELTAERLGRQDRVLSAWIANWDGGAGYRQVLKHAPEFRLASPYWYLTTDDPKTIGLNSPPASASTRADWVAALHRRGVKVIPTVGSRWDADKAEQVFTSPKLTSQHVDALVSLAQRDHLDGLDLDYEGFRWPATQEQTLTLRHAFSGFVARVCGRLHKDGKECTVTIGPATSDASAGVLDYAAIGRAANLVRLMCYDLHSPATAPGPISTIAWTRRVVRYATAEIPASKVELDVPTFGYQWPAPAGGDASVSWEQTQHLIWLHRGSGRRGYSRRAAEAYFHWSAGGEEHTIWFENARSLQPKVALANRYHIRSVGFWGLGNQDPNDWNTLLGLHIN